MKMRALFAAAGAAMSASVALASPQESFTLNNILSDGPDNSGANGVATFNATGAYSVGKLRLSGTLNSINTATYGGESRVKVTAPSGQTATFTPFPGTFTFGSLTATDVVINITTVASASGTWTVRCFESFDDGGPGNVDSEWSDLTITLDDEVPPPPSVTDLGTVVDGTPINAEGSIGTGELKLYRITLAAPVTAAANRWMQLDTNGTGFDTEIAIWNEATGALIAADDDDGDGLNSDMDFGADSGAGADGRDGGLPAGSYIVGVAEFNAVFEAGFGGTFGGAIGGSFILNINAGIVPPDPTRWDETGDASEAIDEAQVPVGTGPLNNIRGTINGNEADIYKIQICDASSFSATTVGNTTMDTQLWLFNDAGKGVALSDDSQGFLQSTLTSAFVGSTGTYYLAISPYNRDPVDSEGNLLWENMPFDLERAPDGPGAPNRVSSWASTNEPLGSTYRITLTGACFPADICLADFNGDGFPDAFDYDDYVACFEGEACPPGKDADFSGDGFVDAFDYDGFVEAFENGCE